MQRQNSLGLKIPPLALGLILAALMWFVAWATPSFNFQIPAHSAVAIVLALLGAAMCISGVVSFRLAKTTVNPMKPNSASSLVVSGIYRYTRNPMYLGFLLVLFGWAAFLGAALTATSVGITARVLGDLGRMSTPAARIIIGAAVIDDVLGLVILSVVSGVASGKTITPGGVVWTDCATGGGCSATDSETVTKYFQADAPSALQIAPEAAEILGLTRASAVQGTFPSGGSTIHDERISPRMRASPGP